MITPVRLAYYKEEDWTRFLDMIDDSASMHKKWKDWQGAYQKTKKDLADHGFFVVDTVVDIDALAAYCSARGIKNDGKARSRYVANPNL